MVLQRSVRLIMHIVCINVDKDKAADAQLPFATQVQTFKRSRPVILSNTKFERKDCPRKFASDKLEKKGNI